MPLFFALFSQLVKWEAIHNSLKRLSNQGNRVSPTPWSNIIWIHAPHPHDDPSPRKVLSMLGGRKATSHDINLIGWLFFSALGIYIMDCCAPVSVLTPWFLLQRTTVFWPYMQVRSMYWLLYCLCERNKNQKRGQYIVYKWVSSDLGVAWAVYWSDTTLNMQTESRRGFNLLNQWGPATKVKAVLAGGDFPFHKPLMWRISQSQTLLIRDSEHWALWWPLICVLGSQ